MTGSPDTRLAPELPPGPRAALVIATATYQDPALSQLRATADDAQALTGVLGDPGIGGFTVTSVIDADERRVRRTTAAFLSGRGTGDVVLVYLSCHGVQDQRNRLYFAAADTVRDELSSTGIPAAWLLEQLEECRARQQVVILDCCFSGAFPKGSKGDDELNLERRLAGNARGRAVLTASRSGEYSFTGDALPGAAISGSVFTAGLVEGLQTGAADTDGDGYISVDEAYDFVSRYVLSLGAAQTPTRSLSGGEWAIVLARSPAGIASRPTTDPGLGPDADSSPPRRSPADVVRERLPYLRSRRFEIVHSDSALNSRLVQRMAERHHLEAGEELLAIWRLRGDLLPSKSTEGIAFTTSKISVSTDLECFSIPYRCFGEFRFERKDFLVQLPGTQPSVWVEIDGAGLHWSSLHFISPGRVHACDTVVQLLEDIRRAVG